MITDIKLYEISNIYGHIAQLCFSVLYHWKLNIFGFWTETKQAIGDKEIHP